LLEDAGYVAARIEDSPRTLAGARCFAIVARA
jgi:hypothetical protein